MFEYYGHIHVYNHGAGAGNPLGTNFDININILSICPFPASFALQIFPIQMHGRPCRKIGQGHSRVILYKLYRARLLDASCKVLKQYAFWFRKRRFLKVFAIYSHGGRLGHVT